MKNLKKIIFSLFIVNLLGLAISCVSSNRSRSSEISKPENTPESFSPSPGITLDNQSCKNPMIDNRDGTEIILVSAARGLGNYRVPEGKYGVKKGEFLQLECSTGKVIGIVKESRMH